MKLRSREIPTIQRKYYARHPYNLKDLKEIILYGQYDKLYRSKKTEMIYQKDLKKGKMLRNHFSGRLQLQRNSYPYNLIGSDEVGQCPSKIGRTGTVQGHCPNPRT